MVLPKSITFELTHRCNCRCEMCRFWVEGSRLELEEMNLDQILGIISDIDNEYKKDGLRPFFGLTGGEPFLKKELLDIVKFFHDKGIKYDMVSNFSVPNKQYLEKLSIYAPERINVSIDGMGSTHNLVRGLDIFDKIIENIKYFKKISPQTSIKINTTITQRNIRELERIAKLAIELGVKLNFQHLNFVTPELLKKQYDLEMRKLKKKTVHEATFYTLGGKEVDELFREVDKINKLIGNGYDITFLPALHNNLSTWYLRPEMVITNSKCDSNRLRIKPDGRLVHCENFVYGDLTNESLNKILNSAEVKQIQELITGTCMPFCHRCCLRFKNYKDDRCF